MHIHLKEGSVTVPLKGSWFESGLKGTMGDLLCSIEESRELYHSAMNN
tara:strand:- start:646 stop:789 length:144 start_codon:yes stop_codon:yes gene_type:complete